MRPRADDARSVARQRGACRGASEADGAGAATVTRIGRLWSARTRKRPRKASTVVRRARRPAPIRFAMPRRAPRVRALPVTTRGGTPAPSTAVAKISPMAATRQCWSEKEEDANRFLKFQSVVLRMRDSAREDRAGSLGSKPGDDDRRRHRRCVGMQAHEPRRGGPEKKNMFRMPKVP